jgi:hypothetical protein
MVVIMLEQWGVPRFPSYVGVHTEAATAASLDKRR